MKSFGKVMCCMLALSLVLVAIPVSAVAADEADGDVAIVYYGGDESDSEPFATINDALDAASTGDVIYLIDDAILQTDDELNDGAILVIPTSADFVDPEKLHDGANNVSGAAQAGNVFATLTVPAGKTLTVDTNATLIVAGNQQSTVPRAGFLTGDYGAIQLEGDLIVDGTLYARGQINGGGTVTANSGGTVYQRFEILDWRGGTASFAAYYDEDHSVYPFELYQAGGVNVTAVYKNGSRMMGQSFIYSAQQTTGAISTVNVVGSSDSLIIFDDQTDPNASVTFTHNSTTGVSTATIKGSASTGDISVDISVFGIHIPLTAEGVGPFGYMQNVVVAEDSTFNVSNELKILPGCTITIKSGATLNASGRLYLYTADKYSADYNNAHWTSASDAIVEVENGGNITGNIGSTSTTFGNVHGATITANAPDEDVWEVTQSGTTVQFHNIPFTMHLTPAPTPAE